MVYQKMSIINYYNLDSYIKDMNQLHMYYPKHNRMEFLKDI